MSNPFTDKQAHEFWTNFKIPDDPEKLKQLEETVKNGLKLNFERRLKERGMKGKKQDKSEKKPKVLEEFNSQLAEMDNSAMSFLFELDNIEIPDPLEESWGYKPPEDIVSTPTEPYTSPSDVLAKDDPLANLPEIPGGPTPEEVRALARKYDEELKLKKEPENFLDGDISEKALNEMVDFLCENTEDLDIKP